MCHSKAEGGQRCHAHAATALTRASDLLREATATGDPDAIASAEQRWDACAVVLASTTEGQQEIHGWADEAAARHDYLREARLRSLARQGGHVRMANLAVQRAAENTREAARLAIPRTTRLLTWALNSPTPEERHFAWTSLTATPISAWTPADRLTLAQNLDKVPGGWTTGVDCWKQLRAHGRANPEEQAALKHPLYWYRHQTEEAIYATNRA